MRDEQRSNPDGATTRDEAEDRPRVLPPLRVGHVARPVSEVRTSVADTAAGCAMTRDGDSELGCLVMLILGGGCLGWILFFGMAAFVLGMEFR